MSDVLRARLAEALLAHTGKRHVGSGAIFCTDGPGGLVHATSPTWREWAEHTANALLSLEGVAIVALPALMVDRSNVAESIKDRPMWEVGGSWTSLTDNAGEIEFETDNQNACGCLNTPDDARALAAALLAASDAAEAVTDA
ncbi:hypothetical protein LAUMK4_05860 [Mycobacterium persicum]|uniref:Uncharacterized protein n=1 Tax=Mycobacterium persicum TaxID=1487726 RepID=A0ABY6RSK2_9MYCO|nr:hypothetical protein [Mycobacterium persicum]ORB93976.1 hypothetical protein B1T44_04900 [Mycobacterium persicum]VBA33061.1 hypothetical protein LAUMK4_05860 [Mycobacterium persicum]